MNIMLAWEVLWSKAYVVAVEKRSQCMLPVADPYSISNVVMLQAQSAALKDFRDKLNGLIEEHETLLETKFKNKEEVK